MGHGNVEGPEYYLESLSNADVPVRWGRLSIRKAFLQWLGWSE